MADCDFTTSVALRNCKRFQWNGNVANPESPSEAIDRRRLPRNTDDLRRTSFSRFGCRDDYDDIAQGPRNHDTARDLEDVATADFSVKKSPSKSAVKLTDTWRKL
ncbi:hypothetical protein KCU68_g54, partial [Aureobasidium melanogenum]